MEENELWKNTTSNAWNVALNVKTETNDFEQLLNYGFECLTVSNGSERETEKCLWTPNWKHGSKRQIEDMTLNL